MPRSLATVAFLLILSSLTEATVARDQGAPAPLRGILLSPDRVTPERLAVWKGKNATAVLVPLDEATKRRWADMSRVVEQAGMTLWPWVEIARNPAMADAHPDWLAAIGAHHDDWRRRFPNAPTAKPGEVVKAWPWVPIGYAPAFEAHRERVKGLLADLPGSWAGVFLNDLQAGPSSCGCGNDQCRWALDYGSPSTAAKRPGDDAAAQLVAEVRRDHSGKPVVPVWVTECEPIDLPGAKDGSGLCGGVGCARGDCWPRYVRQWNPLVAATDGPIAVAAWSETFHRDPQRWPMSVVALFETPLRNGVPLAPSRTVVIHQAWNQPEPAVTGLWDAVKQMTEGTVLALDPIDQSWEPRAVPVAAPTSVAKSLYQPSLFETLINPACSHCIDESRRKAGELRDDDRVLCWIRGKYDGGAIPYRWFLVPYRVISDTYGVFVYDADAGYVRGYPASLDYRFHGWRNGVMVMRHQDGTIFDCLTGLGVEGPRKGERLTPIPTVESDWGPWLKANPGTVAYQMVDKFVPQSLPERPMRESRSTRPADDARLDPEERVFGLELANSSAAWPLTSFGKEPVARKVVLGGQEAVLLWDPRTRTAAAYAPETEGDSPTRVTLAVDAADPEAPWRDEKTGSHWSITGRAVAGASKGQTLRWVPGVMVKWHAWAAEYPGTELRK
jgi:hypothetical protein